MSPEQTRALLLDYQTRLAHWQPARYPTDSRDIPTHLQKVKHARWMVDELLSRDLPADKVNRWLGFIQGALWAAGKYTIDDMREHVIGHNK